MADGHQIKMLYLEVSAEVAKTKAESILRTLAVALQRSRATKYITDDAEEQKKVSTAA